MMYFFHSKRNLLILGIIASGIVGIVYAEIPPGLDIPPTNAFDKIHTDSGSISAVNFSMPLNIVGGSGITVSGTNSTHTVTISSSGGGGSGKGSYNTTKANNVNINTGGYSINFINGTGNPVLVTNSPSRNQVNVTISSVSTPTSRVQSSQYFFIALNPGVLTINFNVLLPASQTVSVNDPNYYEIEALAGHISTIKINVTNWTFMGVGGDVEIGIFKNGIRQQTLSLTGNGLYTFTPSVSWNAGDYMNYLVQTVGMTSGNTNFSMSPVYDYP